MKLIKTLTILSLLIITSCAGGQKIQSQWTETAQEALESVVIVESGFMIPDPDDDEKLIKAYGVGTGSVISSDGWIVTNAHVVTEGYSVSDDITIKFKDKRTFAIEKIFVFKDQDLALLKIRADNLNFFEIRKKEVVVGEPCLAIGNPVPYQFVIKEGIISQVKFDPYIPKNISLGDLTESKIEHIASSATIHPGNSGGPLIDVEGKLIGTNEAVFPRKFIYALAISNKTLLDVLDIVSNIIGKKIYTLSE